MSLALPRSDDGRPVAAARAGRSSFYFAMRILGREQRDAMFEIYAFCRQVDDIADSEAAREWRLARLEQWREAIEALYAGSVPDELAGLSRAIERFSLAKADFLAILDGMRMDAAEDIRAPDLERLDLYCDRVASAVGRLSVRVFGMEERHGRALAHHLGRALQLTNILRDLDEDAAVGRLYLPREALVSVGIDATDPQVVLSHPALGDACAHVVERARGHFIRSENIMRLCPRRTVRAPRIMAAAYRLMLEDLAARGWRAPRRRVRVNRPRLLWIALRHAFA
ncbi:MAG: presqualene diphosphate synthase HpnD [Pseudolabrys sp.]|nr:presqualene diphosphate synthase HpnD [Pseudolabrys sp.]